MGYFWAYSWIWIPIIALLVGGFKEWLKFKEKQQQLGTSTHELEETVATLRTHLAEAEAQQEALVSRIQNLETIVTSQLWDVVGDPALSEAERQHALEGTRAALALPEPEPDPSTADKAARLARRLHL